MRIELEHGSFFYESYGQGLPLLALHGGPGDHRYTRALLEPVFEGRAGWQRIYPDLPGCGQTRVDATIDSYDQVLDILLSLMDGLAPGMPVALAGVSFGGYLARGIVHERIEQVAGICLVVPRIMQDSAQKSVGSHAVLSTEEVFESHLQPGEAWLKNHMVAHTSLALAKIREHFFPGLALFDEAFFGRLHARSPGLSFDVDNLPAPFTSPALILTGRQDAMTGFKDSWRLMEIYPRATYAVLDKAGHLLGFTEQEELFRQLVREWANRVRESLE